jgi:hypothetical protein
MVDVADVLLGLLPLVEDVVVTLVLLELQRFDYKREVIIHFLQLLPVEFL